MENPMKDKFQSLDFGTVPAAVKQEEVKVSLEAGCLMQDYCLAFVREAHRKMPLTAEQDGSLTSEELLSYCNYLLTKRVESLEGKCPDWRKLKLLWIPSFIQFILSQVGIVIQREFGLKFTPVVVNPSTMTFDEAAVISDKISAFEEKLQMVQDAMPRGPYGDVDVMTSAVIADYVRSTHRVSHLYTTYVTAFVNARLVEEMAFKALYRVQYDDLEYIRSALMAGGDTLV